MQKPLTQIGVVSRTPAGRVSLKENFAWTLAGTSLYAACQWGILVSIAKLGTPAMVGQFALALAVSTPVFMLTSLQLRTVLATDTRDEYRLGHYLAPRLIGTAAGLILIVAIILVAHFRRDTALVVLLVSFAKAAETLSDIIYGFWQKHERLDKISVALIGRGIGSLVAVAAVLFLTRDILLATGALAFYWVIWLVTYERKGAKELLASVSPKEFLQPEWDAVRSRQLLMLSFPLGIVMLLLSLNVNIPRYFVEHYLGESALGYFAAMAYVFVAGNTVMAAMGQSAMPRLARYFESDHAAFAQLLNKMIMLGVVVGIAGVGLALLFGPTILRWLYRADYAQYGSVFSWLMVAAAFSYAASMLGYGMTAARIFRPQVPLFLTASLVTALACWILIPHRGMAGAAFAVVTGAVFSCAGTAWVIFTRLHLRLSGEET